MGLNPFEFRAGLELQSGVGLAALRVLIPLNSGLAWSRQAQCIARSAGVLIPLNSGLAWSRSYPSQRGLEGGLNPFEFRAGLERAMATSRSAFLVLIPLNSGLAWSRCAHRNLSRQKRLNPFEFRAGLERGNPDSAFDL